MILLSFFSVVVVAAGEKAVVVCDVDVVDVGLYSPESAPSSVPYYPYVST